MEKSKSFIEQFVEYVKGDEATVIAAKVQKKASQIIKTEISAAEVNLLELEESLEEAKESLRIATLNNGKIIESGEGKTAYIDKLIRCHNNMVTIEEEIDSLKQKIKILTDIQERISK